MFHHLNGALTREIREATGGLPSWPGDPSGLSVDYTESLVAYAVNVTLLQGDFEWHPSGLRLPTPSTKALLVQRASGDGAIGSWSGVSGYVDKLHDPQLQLTDEAFDPVAYAARAELFEECGISWQKIRAIEMHLGAVLRGGINLALGHRFEEPRFARDGVLHVLPLVGMCDELPYLNLNPRELSAAQWMPLEELAQAPDLSEGYLERTLPNALGSLGLRPSAIVDMLAL